MRTFLFVLLLLFHLPAGADEWKLLVHEFKNESQAQYFSIPPVMMRMSRMFRKDMDMGHSDVKTVTMLFLEDCSSRVKKRFNKRISVFKDADMEPLAFISESDTPVKIWIHSEEDRVKELLILCGGESCALIYFKGDIDPADIEGLVRKRAEPSQ